MIDRHADDEILQEDQTVQLLASRSQHRQQAEFMTAIEIEACFHFELLTVIAFSRKSHRPFIQDEYVFTRH